MQGYVKLHRSILSWEWYKDLPVRILFEHCLLKANHKVEKWRGLTIEAGQFVTSLNHLSEETGLSVSQIRTAFNKLEMTQELTKCSQGKYSVITIKNWATYQTNDTINDKQIASSSQGNRKVIATNKNEKNEKNIKEEEEERAQDLKNWYGEYSNVFLDAKQLGKLKSMILDDKFLFFLINELSSNIAVGRAPRFDINQPWGHFVMIRKYWEYRKKNPDKFKPKGDETSAKKRNEQRENRIRELEREWNEQS